MKNTETSGGFYPLHIHTNNSFPYGIAATPTVPDVFARAKQVGLEKIAITDRNNLYGLGQAMQAAKTTNVEFIPGVELPLDFETGRHEPIYATFLALTTPGLLAIYRYITQVMAEGKVLRMSDITPDIFDVATLVRGPRHDKLKQALTLDNIFYAVDSPDPAAFRLVNDFENKFKKNVVAHEFRLAYQDTDLFNLLLKTRPKDFSKSDRQNPLQYTIQSPIVFNGLYHAFPQALGRMREIAKASKVEIPVRPVLEPMNVPANTLPEFYFSNLVDEITHKIKTDTIRVNRVLEEYQVVKELKNERYLLVGLDLVDFLKQKHIPYVTSGSANNSELMHQLGITSVDPMDHYFSRFMNRYRIDLPDIDITVPYDRRREVVEYILKRYPDAVIPIVLHHFQQDGATALLEKHHLPTNKTNIKLIVDAKIVSGVSTHPSGIIFTANAPRQKLPGGKIAQFNRDDAESYFLYPKFDILNSIPLTRVSRTKELLHMYPDSDLPDNDKESLATAFNNGLGTGADSPHVQNILKTIAKIVASPSRDHIAQALALARPIGRSIISFEDEKLDKITRELYYRNLQGLKYPWSDFKEITAVIGKTNYVFVYKDQVSQFAHDVAGMSIKEADRLRKLDKISAAEKDELFSHFDLGLRNKGYPKEIRDILIFQVKNFVNYSFDEGHSEALDKPVYDLAYLKTHYPKQFWAATLSTLAERPGSANYHLQVYINEILHSGIKIGFPQLSQLPAVPYLKGNTIILGKKLLPNKENVMMAYDAFYQMLIQGNTPLDKLIMTQLESFGTCFTNDPLDLFPSFARFNPLLKKQTIIGEYANSRRWEKVTFITLDSNRLVNIIAPNSLMDNINAKKLFWLVEIVKQDRLTDTWILQKIYRPPPLPTTSKPNLPLWQQS